MTITVYGIKNCNSMKKTFEQLDLLNISYEFFDYKKQVIDFQTFLDFERIFGLSQLINKKGTTYRKLEESQKQLIENAILAPSDHLLQDLYMLVQANQSLLKRPVILGDYQEKPVGVIGFNEELMQNIFG